MKTFRIVSEDGFTDSTKIYFGDEQVHGVTDVNININIDEPLITATFTVLLPTFDLHINKDDVELITHDLSSLYTQEENIDQHDVT